MEIRAEVQKMLDQAAQDQAKAQAEADAAEARQLELVSAMKSYDKELQAKYDEGVEYGKGLIVLPDPDDGEEKLYSQAEANALVASVKAEKDVEKDAEIKALKEDHADEMKELEAEVADASSAVEERDQLLKLREDDKDQWAALRSEVDQRLAKAQDEI